MYLESNALLFREILFSIRITMNPVEYSALGNAEVVCYLGKGLTCFMKLLRFGDFLLKSHLLWQLCCRCFCTGSKGMAHFFAPKAGQRISQQSEEVAIRRIDIALPSPVAFNFLKGLFCLGRNPVKLRPIKFQLKYAQVLKYYNIG